MCHSYFKQASCFQGDFELLCWPAAVSVLWEKTTRKTITDPIQRAKWLSTPVLRYNDSIHIVKWNMATDVKDEQHCQVSKLLTFCISECRLNVLKVHKHSIFWTKLVWKTNSMPKLVVNWCKAAAIRQVRSHALCLWWLHEAFLPCEACQGVQSHRFLLSLLLYVDSHHLKWDRDTFLHISHNLHAPKSHLRLGGVLPAQPHPVNKADMMGGVVVRIVTQCLSGISSNMVSNSCSLRNHKQSSCFYM